MGDATLRTSPFEPTIPREITLAPLNGSKFDRPRTSPVAASRNSATWRPRTTTAAPRSGARSSSAHTRTHVFASSIVIG
jgi:hypothetical protein